jgi:hypothetical protein
MKTTRDFDDEATLDGYLDITALHPLDVIVCASQCNIHREIQKWSSGSFAHAGLLLTPMVTFESGLEGLFFTVTDELSFASVEGSLHLAMDLSDYTHFKVLRHPELANVSEEDLCNVQVSALGVCEELNLLNYPHLLRLVAAMPGLGAVASMADRLTRISDRLRHRRARGLFCSELVARVFNDIELPILGAGQSPAVASPQDISDSVLVEIHEAVLPPETCCIDCPNDIRDRILAPYVKLRQQLEPMPSAVSETGVETDGCTEMTVLKKRKQRSEDAADLLDKYQQLARSRRVAQGTNAESIQQQGDEAIRETIARHRRAEPAFIRELVANENEMFQSLHTSNSSIEEIRASLPTTGPEPIHDIHGWISRFTSPIVAYLDEHNPAAWDDLAPELTEGQPSA